VKFIDDIKDYVSRHPWLDRWVLNKYVITTVLFGIYFLFIGDQSLIKQMKRARKISSLQEQIQESRKNIDVYQHELNYLANPDSLERYAREHYHMHAPNEEVYIVK